MVNADGLTILRYSPEKHMIFWVVIDLAPGVMAPAQHRVIARHGGEIREIRGCRRETAAPAVWAAWINPKRSLRAA
jgi:hypothetical protein